VFTALSFIAYQAGFSSVNLAGRVGSGLADVVVQALGVAAYLAPLYLLIVAVSLFRKASDRITFGRAASALAAALCVAVLLAVLSPPPHERSVAFAGGWIGGFLAAVLQQAFGTAGTLLLSLAVLSLTISFLTGSPLGGLVGLTKKVAGVVWMGVRKLPLRKAVEIPLRQRENVRAGASETVRPEAAPIIVLADEVQRKGTSVTKKRGARNRQEELRFEADGRYQLPPARFLASSAHDALRVDEDGLRKSSQILETKLADFGIQGRVVEVRPGPVITTFDIEPAPGVKVNRIVNLADDLAMALRVPGVRILAPVPGKAVVGIEVANPRREEVLLRELIESEAFVRLSSPLALALGKDTAGGAVIGDLARMPHLMIAGATGSGKSVAVNAMIMSILYKSLPRDVRFVMIDLKMLELSVYEDIPHLLVPVVTDPKLSVAVLNNIVEQMEDRYRLMKCRGVRNIDGYNRLVREELACGASGVIELRDLADGGEVTGPTGAVNDGPATQVEPLAKIVVIIDELADLMMTMGRKVEEPITRLAQKARAAGIHLIVATQRPSVDVITGLIKANFPARISFQTTARVDSRTILDSIGAERLLGRGDMLFLPPGSARLQRLHGPLITEEEIHEVVGFIKKQGSPQYVYSLLEAPGADEESEFEDDLEDELYDQAVHLVTESGQASISWVQRRLRVGYNRAARMIERMEKEGIVSPSEGGRPREVLARRIDGA
jgi:DNA segregation ATPase FtsK/SpoIIIE, S-DNA-T family